MSDERMDKQTDDIDGRRKININLRLVQRSVLFVDGTKWKQQSLFFNMLQVTLLWRPTHQGRRHRRWHIQRDHFWVLRRTPAHSHRQVGWTRDACHCKCTKHTTRVLSG